MTVSMTSTAGIDYAAQGWNAPEFRGLGAGGCTRNSELKMLGNLEFISVFSGLETCLPEVSMNFPHDLLVATQVRGV